MITNKDSSLQGFNTTNRNFLCEILLTQFLKIYLWIEITFLSEKQYIFRSFFYTILCDQKLGISCLSITIMSTVHIAICQKPGDWYTWSCERNLYFLVFYTIFILRHWNVKQNKKFLWFVNQNLWGLFLASFYMAFVGKKDFKFCYLTNFYNIYKKSQQIKFYKNN